MSTETYDTVPESEPDESAVTSDESSIGGTETVYLSIPSPIGSQIEWKVETLSVYEVSDVTGGVLENGYYLIGESTAPSESGWTVDGHRPHIPDDIGQEGWFIESETFEDNEDVLEPLLESYDGDNDE